MTRVENMQVLDSLKLCLLRPADEERPRREDAVATLVRRSADVYKVLFQDAECEDELVRASEVVCKLGEAYELPAEDVSGAGPEARRREGRERERAEEAARAAAEASARAEWEARLGGIAEQLLAQCCVDERTLEERRAAAAAHLAEYRRMLAQPPPIVRGRLLVRCHDAIARAHIVDISVAEAIGEHVAARAPTARGGSGGRRKRSESVVQTGLGADVTLAIPQLKAARQKAVAAEAEAAQAAAQKKAAKAAKAAAKARAAQAAADTRQAVVDRGRAELVREAPSGLRNLLLRQVKEACSEADLLDAVEAER